jgi:excinuclease ABC subunit C
VSGFDQASFLAHLTQAPGVYRMLDTEGRILYVGKARNLKRRVANYFLSDPGRSGEERPDRRPPKTQALMSHTARVEVTVVHTETEALLLEQNLIKQHRPKYNILMRDDKSYPYVHLTEHAYPRLAFYRGSKREKGRFFGPYPSTVAVRETLNWVQKAFRLRNCSDSFFQNRTRPCLQHQIGRCSAPCVGLIGAPEYAADVASAIEVLDGRDQAVVERLAAEMDEAAARQAYERAAALRDRIARLKQVQLAQHVEGERGDADVIAVRERGGVVCVAVLFVRAGRNLGSKHFFPRAAGATPAEVAEAFVSQYYADKPVPAELIVDAELEEGELLEASLSSHAGHRVEIKHAVRGERARWLDMARVNAAHALDLQLATDAQSRARLEALAEALALEAAPERLECFDVSHTAGEATVAACVVFVAGVAARSEYRRFNIKGVTGGDDYAALRQALSRRYTRLKAGEAPLPDVLFVDGGQGQVDQAVAVLAELGIDGVPVVGIAKGPTRRPGLEQLVVAGRELPVILPPDSAALHLIQQVRDEAHRFAITGMRRQRSRRRMTSPLEGIAGLGPRKRQALLTQFGGLQGLKAAGVEDLMRVRGISRDLAQRIWASFHAGDAS